MTTQPTIPFEDAAAIVLWNSKDRDSWELCSGPAGVSFLRQSEAPHFFYSIPVIVHPDGTVEHRDA